MIDGGDRDIRLARHVRGHHRRIVHAINLLAGDNQHRVFLRVIEQVQALVQSIRLPTVNREIFRDRRRYGRDELPQVGIEYRPPVAQMILQ